MVVCWLVDRPAGPAAALATPPSVPLHVCAGLPLWARQVVFDEADLLLAGAYEKHIRIIMDVSGI